MAKRSSRKRRKARQRASTGPGRDTDEAPLTKPTAEGSAEFMARGYTRGRAKDEAARAALVPLAPGERPTAVTVAGVVVALLGLINLISYLAGQEVQGKRPSAVGIALFTAVMALAAYGCFRARYWAVLGVQAILGLLIVLFSLLLVGASTVVTGLICLAVITSSGALFWYLIKAMARIQMPERPGAR